jgi:hypothetical protein
MANPAEISQPEARSEEDPGALSAADNLAAWRLWVARGPQGPIEDDAEPDFPADAAR